MLAKIILLKKTSGHRSFMLRLTDKGKKAYRTVKPPFTFKEWDYKNQKIKGVRPDGSAGYQTYIANRKYITDTEAKYTNQINELLRLDKPFSFQKVFELIDNPNQQIKTVYEVFKARILALKGNSKYGTAEAYQGTYNKLKAFHSKDIMFNELTDNLLLKFKKDMINDGLSRASISIHLRNIRAIYNFAIKKMKAAKLDDYPFINDEIMDGLKTGYKSRAISKDKIDQIRKIMSKLDEGTDLWCACAYFIFGYVGRGINFTDIARLKWENRSQGRITYIRRKNSIRYTR